MIHPQYTYDTAGKKVGVFLAIEDWDQINQIPVVSELAENGVLVPEWQMELCRKELKKNS